MNSTYIFQKNVYTGEAKKGPVLQLGDYFINLKRKNHFDQFDTVTKLHQVRLTENFRLPIFYGSSTDYESVTKPFKYTKEGAEKKAQEQLELLLDTLREKEVQVKREPCKNTGA